MSRLVVKTAGVHLAAMRKEGSTMITQDMVPQLIGRQAYDRQGDKVGKVGQVYVDDRQGTPMWATVNTGLFGNNESFVPLGSATAPDGDLKLDVTKDQVKNAPHVGRTENQLSAAEEGQLRSHYGQQSAGGQGSNPEATTGRHDADRDQQSADDRNRARGTAGHGTEEAGDRGAGRDAGSGMTRSEERMRVGTESEETGTVRLRKYVVTEEQQVTVPVSHEEVRVEREPVAGNQAQGTGAIGEDEQQVTLRAERASVDKTVEDVENVRLSRETVTDEETVSDTVRKEQVEVDDPNDQLHNRRDK